MFMLPGVSSASGRTHHAHPPLPRGRHFTRTQLMEASEQRLSEAARSGVPEDELVAERLLNCTRLYMHWQSEHDAILRRVAGQRERRRHAMLLSAVLGTIHRKAFFEYLMSTRLRGPERVHFVRRFFGHDDYTRTLVLEHGNFLRSAASFMCLTHIGARLLHDPLFDLPLAEYEDLYADYFFASSEELLGRADDPLAGYTYMTARSLKRQVELRRVILMRQATGTSGRGSPAPVSH